MGRKNKPRVIPEQNNKICRSICLCQLTVVLSCVSIVYLSVAVYRPSYKAFQSGFEPFPVMCQTIDTVEVNNCPWTSCGEWCLSKTTGMCTQITATVRRNATEVQFYHCMNYTNTLCKTPEPNASLNYNCNDGNLCENLYGTFNCTNGRCYNMSLDYVCDLKGDGITLDPEKDNVKLTGFFQCNGPKCTKINRNFKCDRKCKLISTKSVNVLIMVGNSIVAVNCDYAEALNEARGSDPGVKIAPLTIWKNDTQHALLANCAEVYYDENTLQMNASDCLNGTLANISLIDSNSMNFSRIWRLFENSTDILDPAQRFLPMQSNLTINNAARLYINLEGCVNTLRDECAEFQNNYGCDGDNDTAQSRYKCYYNKNDPSFVIARFDLEKTYRELLIASTVPTILFVISFISLCIITNSVKVGDDTKMRCKYCSGDNSDMDDTLIVNNRRRNTCIEDHRPILDGQEEVMLSDQGNILEMADGSNRSLANPSNENLDRPYSKESNPNVIITDEKTDRSIVLS